VSKEIVFSYSLILTVPPSTYYSTIKENLQPTSTTIFDKPLHSNVDVNNVTIFIAYYVGHHLFLLASEAFFYHLFNFYKKLKQMLDPIIYSCFKMLYNDKWEIRTLNKIQLFTLTIHIKNICSRGWAIIHHNKVKIVLFKIRSSGLCFLILWA